MVGVAVNVTLVPTHIVVALAPILTLAINIGLTVIVIVFDVAGEPVKHGVALLVITTLTTSLLAIVVLVNVVPVAPEISVPFIFHW